MIVFIQTTQPRRNERKGSRCYPFETREFSTVQDLVEGIRQRGYVIGTEIIYNPEGGMKVILDRKPVVLKEESYASIEESWGRFVEKDGRRVE